MTNDIQFRPVRATDAAVIKQGWGSNPENFIYLTAPVLNTEAAAQRYIDQCLSKSANRAYHIVCNGTAIGLVKTLTDKHRALVGYVIDRAYWGQGIATTAVEFITQELMNSPDIQRIWATCALENVGSIKVLEKCGYQREGILRNWAVYPAQGSHAQDNHVYCYPI